MRIIMLTTEYKIPKTLNNLWIIQILKIKVNKDYQMDQIQFNKKLLINIIKNNTNIINQTIFITSNRTGTEITWTY